MIIGLASKLGRCAGEQLGMGRNLGMHFQAYDDFPITGGAFDELFRIGRAGIDEHGVVSLACWQYKPLS